MSQLEPLIRKLYDESESEDESYPASEMVWQDVRYRCEERNTFTQHGDDFFSFLKCISADGKEFIRMVCSVKLGKKKVDNVTNIMCVIRAVENVLIFIDSCDAIESDGFMHLDMIKELKTN